MSEEGLESGIFSEEEIICIMCPLGCRLNVRVKMENNEKEVIEMDGHTCKRGQEYAREEVTDPKRILTATCRISSAGRVLRFPVKTDSPIPVDCIPEVLRKLYALSIEEPVEAGEIVLKNVDGRGTNVVSTKSIGELDGSSEIP